MVAFSQRYIRGTAPGPFRPKRRRIRPMYSLFTIIGIVVVALAVINFIG